MNDLTQRQRDVLAFIRSFQVENWAPPTRREISMHFGWASANAAEEHLRVIARKGYITLRRGMSRGIFINATLAKVWAT